MKFRDKITRDEVMDLLRYDSDTGFLYWKKKVRRRAMSERAGTQNPYGYRQVGIRQVVYKEHRLVWLIVNGEWPEGFLDHVNGSKNDNRIENLREANHSLNQANTKIRSSNKSGLKGINFHKHSGLWHARITKDYKLMSLGYFKSKEEAHLAYVEAAKKVFGEFSNDGRT